MPRLSGLFDSFDNLDNIDTDSLISWLKEAAVQASPIQLENYLANKILYPSSLPLSDADMKIELAILREALRVSTPRQKSNTNSMLGDNAFLNVTLRKIIIPAKFLQFVPDLVSLAWVFIDALLVKRNSQDFFEDLWTVILSGDADEVVGSILLPQFKNPSDKMELSVLGKLYKIKPGSFYFVPCSKERCEIAYKFDQGRILGKQMNAVEVYGGSLGIVIDGRNR